MSIRYRKDLEDYFFLWEKHVVHEFVAKLKELGIKTDLIRI